MSAEDQNICQLTDQLIDVDIVETAPFMDADDPNNELIIVDKTDIDNDDDADLDDVILEDDHDDQYGHDDMDDDNEEGEEYNIGVNPEDVADTSKHNITCHTDTVYVVAINSDATLVATGGGDDIAHITSLKDGKIVFSTPKSEDSINNIAFNHDGKYVAVGSMDGFINVYDTTTGSLKADFSCDGDLECLSWHPIGNVILAGTADGLVWMWDVNTNSPMHTLAGHNERVNHVAFTNCHKNFISTCDDGSVFIRKGRDGTDVFRYKGLMAHKAPIISFSQHPTDPIFATGSEDGQVQIVSMQDKNQKILKVLDEAHQDSVETLAFGKSHSNFLATGSIDGNLKIFDLARSCILRHTFPHPDVVVKIVWHPTKPLVISACNDAVVRVFNVITNTLVKEFTGHVHMILDIAISADGNSVITGSDDKTAKVFDLSDL